MKGCFLFNPSALLSTRVSVNWTNSRGHRPKSNQPVRKMDLFGWTAVLWSPKPCSAKAHTGTSMFFSRMYFIPHTGVSYILVEATVYEGRLKVGNGAHTRISLPDFPIDISIGTPSTLPTTLLSRWRIAQHTHAKYNPHNLLSAAFEPHLVLF